MIDPPMTELRDTSSEVGPAVSASNKRFEGKRVAMVVFSPYPGDPRPRRAVDALVGEGATVDLICLSHENVPRREALGGINVLRIPLTHDRRGKFQYAWRYSSFIFISSLIFSVRTLARRYDLVYVHNMPDVLVATGLIPKLFGAKIVLDLHDPMPELMMTIFQAAPDSKSVQLLKRLEKWSIACADLVVTVNVACKRIFSARSCPAEKIAVVMNSPDGRIFPFREAPERNAGGQRDQKCFVIMYHGSLVERNGLEVAIDALEQVQKTAPDTQLQVFGAGTPFLERMMEKVRQKNLQHAVQYLGWKRTEDLVAEIDKCDLGIVPNQRNAFTEINTPTRIFEYLARGKAVIAPSTPGILDYFSKDSLLCFEPGNPEDLAKQIEYAFSHPDEIQEIVRKGQQVFLEHTWDRERETLLSRLSAVLQRG